MTQATITTEELQRQLGELLRGDSVEGVRVIQRAIEWATRVMLDDSDNEVELAEDLRRRATHEREVRGEEYQAKASEREADEAEERANLLKKRSDELHGLIIRRHSATTIPDWLDAYQR